LGCFKLEENSKAESVVSYHIDQQTALLGKDKKGVGKSNYYLSDLFFSDTSDEALGKIVQRAVGQPGLEKCAVIIQQINEVNNSSNAYVRHGKFWMGIIGE